MASKVAVLIIYGIGSQKENFKGKQSSIYTLIHEHIKAYTKELYGNLIDQQTCPLIIMAYSLEGNIMSNHIWDCQTENYPDDVLGYPLRKINNYYEFIEDIHINVEGFLTSWSPILHNSYWTDNYFTKPVTSLITECI